MAKKQDPVKPVLDSDSDSASDDSSEPEPIEITKKPSDGPKKPTAVSKKPRSKPEPETPAKSTAKKRLSELNESENKGNKKTKNKAGPEPEPEKSEKKSIDDPKKAVVLFQRIWSEDDEIAVLNGLIDYKEKNKADPVADLNAFHEFIKDDLRVDATKTQLQHKIRRFRQKYEKNKSKEKEGRDRSFSNAHEKKAYELSKLVWGNERPMASIRAHMSPVKKSEDDVEKKEPEVVVKNVDKVSAEAVAVAGANGFSMRQMISRIGMELFEGEDKVEGEGESEWRRLRVAEVEAYMKNLEVLCAATKVVLDALKAGNH